MLPCVHSVSVALTTVAQKPSGLPHGTQDGNSQLNYRLDATVELPADGAKLSLDLPAGTVELVVATLPAIGRYGAASLFSPMDNFTDAETAWATALACLGQLCTPPKPAESGPLATPVDRRSLFRFGLGGSRR